VDNSNKLKVVNSNKLLPVDNNNNRKEDNNKPHKSKPNSNFQVTTSSPETLAEDLLMPNTRESHQLDSQLTLMTFS